MRTSFGLIACLLVLTGAAHAQVEFIQESFDYDDHRPAAGHWLGNLKPGALPDTWTALLIGQDEKGQWTATVTILPAFAIKTPCEEVRVEGSSVSFIASTAAGKIRFKGEVADDGQRFRGEVTVTGGELPEPSEGSFELARTPRPMDLPCPLAFTGQIEIPQVGQIEMTFVFAETPGGNWVGHLDVPAQAILGFPMINVNRNGDAIGASIPSLPLSAELEAEFADAGRRLTGRFRQGSNDLAVDFARNDGYAGPQLKRPQHPRPPYPYDVREVTIAHPESHTLAGTLTMPTGDGPFAAAVLISGSGPHDRDETIYGHKPFLVIADYLTRHGIAVLRYDDRGTSDSTGVFHTATSQDFATDALAAVQFLKTVEGIDPKRIGLIGHSEGALIAPMTAGSSDDVSFVVLLAGPGVPGHELLQLQRELLLKAGGADEQTIAITHRQQQEMFDLILKGIRGEALEKSIRPLIELQTMATTGLRGEALEEFVDGQVKQIASPWMAFFLTYDPQPALAKIRCPVLALNGTLDLQVWHEQNLPAIERAVKEGNGRVTIKSYKGLNHLFQPATTGSIMEYGVIETTLDKAVLRDIVAWVEGLGARG